MQTLKLHWAKRAKVIRSELSVRRQWRSEDGRIVEHVKYHHPSLPPVYRIIYRGCVVSRHRTKAAAFRAAEHIQE